MAWPHAVADVASGAEWGLGRGKGGLASWRMLLLTSSLRDLSRHHAGDRTGELVRHAAPDLHQPLDRLSSLNHADEMLGVSQLVIGISQNELVSPSPVCSSSFLLQLPVLTLLSGLSSGPPSSSESWLRLSKQRCSAIKHTTLLMLQALSRSPQTSFELPLCCVVSAP